MHAAFVDFSKAFNFVNHRVLWAVLRARSLVPKRVDLIQDLYADSNSSVGAQGIKSRPFPLLSGVRQGCPLSPILFNFFMDFMRPVNHDCATKGVADFRVAGEPFDDHDDLGYYTYCPQPNSSNRDGYNNNNNNNRRPVTLAEHSSNHGKQTSSNTNGWGEKN